MSEAAQRKEKQKWATEKPNLGNAGRMRGIHFIEPADEDFKKTVRNAWRKLEVPMPAGNALQGQGKNVQGTCRNLDAPRRNTHASLEPTDVRESAWKELYTQIMKTILQGINSLNHYNLVHKFIPVSEAMKIPGAKAVVDKEWEERVNILAWHLT